MNTWIYRVVVNFGPSATHNTLENALRDWDAQTFNTSVYAGMVEYREWDGAGNCVRSSHVLHVDNGQVYVLPTIGDLP